MFRDKQVIKAVYDDVILPGTWKEIDTGVEFDWPRSFFFDRSYLFFIDKELAIRRGLSVHYVGDEKYLKVAFFNHQEYPVRLKPGMVLGYVKFFRVLKTITF
jgi:hypothetical protein